MRFIRVGCAILLPGLPLFAQSTYDLTGKPDASINEPFTQVAGVRHLPGNHAIVTDQFERLVFLVDFATGSRRQIGRQGDGPAEYRFPMAPLPAEGNTTWILDATLRRVPIEDAAFPPAMPPFIASTVLCDASGRIWVGRSYRSSDRTWRYDLYDAQGGAVGVATLPTHSRIVGFGDGVAFVARTDPNDDLVHLERHRLR